MNTRLDFEKAMGGACRESRPPPKVVLRPRLALLQDLYIIQIDGFTALLDDPHKMIAGGELRGKPEEIESLLVEAVRLIVNEHRHGAEILPALIAQTELLPCKTEGGFIPHACCDMDGTFVGVLRSRSLSKQSSTDHKQYWDPYHHSFRLSAAQFALA